MRASSPLRPTCAAPPTLGAGRRGPASCDRARCALACPPRQNNLLSCQGPQACAAPAAQAGAGTESVGPGCTPRGWAAPQRRRRARRGAPGPAGRRARARPGAAAGPGRAGRPAAAARSPAPPPPAAPAAPPGPAAHTPARPPGAAASAPPWIGYFKPTLSCTHWQAWRAGPAGQGKRGGAGAAGRRGGARRDLAAHGQAGERGPLGRGEGRGKVQRVLQK